MQQTTAFSRQQTAKQIRRMIGVDAFPQEGALKTILDLRSLLSVPSTLRDFKVPGDNRDLIGDMAIVDPTAGGNPVKLTKELALEIFDRAMEGRL